MGIDVGSQDRVHPRQVPLALLLEPIEHVTVDTKMHGRLALRHHDLGSFPEIVSHRSALWGVGTGPAVAARAFLLQLAK